MLYEAWNFTNSIFKCMSLFYGNIWSRLYVKLYKIAYLFLQSDSKYFKSTSVWRLIIFLSFHFHGYFLQFKICSKIKSYLLYRLCWELKKKNRMEFSDITKFNVLKKFDKIYKNCSRNKGFNKVSVLQCFSGV